MANSPIRVPIPSREPINSAFVSPHERIKAGAFDVDTIFATLRESLSSGTQEVGSFATSIAEAAQFLTDASGAALGLRYGDGVFCLGRSGETTPPLGAELTVKSGFSAECVRTAKSLRCDDARHDYRTDAAVCRRLGVFSIAAVPVRSEQGCVGLLEVFSNRTYAFSEKHMVFLERLAELASIAQERESNRLIPKHGIQAQSGGRERELRAVTASVKRIWELARPRNWALGAAILALVVSVVRLEPWQTPHASVPRTHPVEQQPTTQPERVVIDAVIPKPSPVHAAAVTKTAAWRTVLPDDVTIRRAQSSTASLASQAEQQRATQSTPQDLLPPATANAPTTSPLVDLASNSGTLPEPALSISQGLSGGTLLRKVQPTYPKQALSLRIQGSVTLMGTVGETGRLQGLKIETGDPILARAALDAVQQWQYQPFMLNGKPIARTTEITVNFKLPQ
jgi:TonB family protein